MVRKTALRVGARFRFVYRTRLCHVVGVIDTDEGRMIAYRSWALHRQRWDYAIEFAEKINVSRFTVRGAVPLTHQRTEQLSLLDEASP
jgi:hypothetical protein